MCGSRDVPLHDRAMTRLVSPAPAGLFFTQQSVTLQVNSFRVAMIVMKVLLLLSISGLIVAAVADCVDWLAS
jgi:hypothetical protein